MVTNLRYADDTTLLAGTKEDLVELVGRVRRASEKAGLYLNVGKTKVMATGDIGEVTVDGKDIEVVTKFVFLEALITEDALCEKEVRRRIAMGKSAMGGLTSIWKDRGVTLETKVKLVKVLVFPIYIYIIQILSVCLCVCVSVKYRRPNCWTDHGQIWHAYADRPGNGSYQKLAP